MSVLLDTSLGPLVIDLYTDSCPRLCLNFLKLVKAKAYHGCLIFNVQPGFLFQTGDPTGTGRGGESINGKLYGAQANGLEDEFREHLKHKLRGAVSMIRAAGGTVPHSAASQFLITLSDSCASLDERHMVFGIVAEGWETLDAFDKVLCDESGRPYADIRIHRAEVLHDPFPDPKLLENIIPPQSPTWAKPPAEVIPSRLSLVEEAELRARTEREIELLGTKDPEMIARLQMEEREQREAMDARTRAVVLEMVGDLPSADVAPPDTVLFVAKLNPVTKSEDLELIFSRFGEVKKAEVIRDAATSNSLGYAFIEFTDKDACERAYFKMNGVLIDDRRIHVDFSQSVSKLWNSARRGQGMRYNEDQLPSQRGGRGGDRGRDSDRGRSRDAGPRRDSEHRDRDQRRDRDADRHSRDYQDRYGREGRNSRRDRYDRDNRGRDVDRYRGRDRDSRSDSRDYVKSSYSSRDRKRSRSPERDSYRSRDKDYGRFDRYDRSLR